MCFTCTPTNVFVQNVCFWILKNCTEPRPDFMVLILWHFLKCETHKKCTHCSELSKVIFDLDEGY